METAVQFGVHSGPSTRIQSHAERAPGPDIINRSPLTDAEAVAEGLKLIEISPGFLVLDERISLRQPHAYPTI
jgi:hypothetical protein